MLWKLASLLIFQWSALDKYPELPKVQTHSHYCIQESLEQYLHAKKKKKALCCISKNELLYNYLGKEFRSMQNAIINRLEIVLECKIHLKFCLPNKKNHFKLRCILWQCIILVVLMYKAVGKQQLSYPYAVHVCNCAFVCKRDNYWVLFPLMFEFMYFKYKQTSILG